MKKSFRSQANFILLIATVILTSGMCTSEEEDITPELPVASSIEMEFPKSELTVGETMNLKALVKDNEGNTMNNQTLTWTSSNPNVISVDSGGLAQAKSSGTASIEVKNQTGIKVAHNFNALEPEAESPKEPHRFEVTPSEIIIEVGQKVQVEIKVFDIDGVEIENPEILYKSHDEQVSTVSDGGLVEGLRAGSTEIHFEVSAKSSKIPVTVTSEDLVLTKIEVFPKTISGKRGEQIQFSAKGFDQFDQEMSGITFDWKSSNGCLANIDEVGLVSAYTPGNARMTASVGEISSYGTISVSKSEKLVAENFEGKWNICEESNGNNFAVIELAIESSNDITRSYKGEIKRFDGSSFIVMGIESIPDKSISINWVEEIQGGARTFIISAGTFIDEFAIKARHTDRRTLTTYDVRLSKL
ncbi:hypothetical protein P872_21700 [Rhodonellum psychrophilum GCM71 = DSM 17998]|uniref:BIG2 domain-containing protein n=2 Tax=Rhodonellum TaxID=336827 RepID=U5BV35_9BACT|nr:MULTISPECIES: Ig-like domain-containing protein [Rhodonellum]ERM80451.1 hypothetical protein P872_21700 [Rhodonellum psychrophilum GCM71 = DSM 17998]SDZ23617.1 Ig-like domain (group 2) [Rhodonellum ikkaensis]